MEDKKFRFDMILKVLAWGTVAYFLVTGYSINQSGLFELRSGEQKISDSDNQSHNVFKDLDTAKLERAKELESQAANPPAGTSKDAVEEKEPAAVNKDSKDKPLDPAKLRLEAAQLRMDVYLAREERGDGRRRAWGLISAAVIYSVLYPIVVFLVYQRTKPAGGFKKADGPAEKDVVPVGVAVGYAIFMSVATCFTAIGTAWY